MTRYEAAIWRFQLESDDITRRTLAALDRLAEGTERPASRPYKSAGTGPMITASSPARFELIECKGVAAPDAGSFIAYGSSWQIDSDNERIEPGAFSSTIKANGGEVPMLFNHSRDMIIGIASGLAEDSRGLSFAGRLAKTERGRDVAELLKLGALNRFSIGFQTVHSHIKNGTRVITELQLREISVVPFASNLGAQLIPGTLRTN